MKQKQWFKPLAFNYQASLFTVLIYLSGLTLVAQDLENYAHASFAEKIYLQLDRQVYTNNETIWFKAIVTHALDHRPTTLSGVLYVDLIAPDETIVNQKTLSLNAGVADNFFELNRTLTNGTYAIRAYTEWNKNFDQDFFFQTYIQIFDERNLQEQEPVQTTLITQGDGQKRIQANFNIQQLDSSEQKEFKLYLFLDEEKDSLRIKKNKQGNFQLDYLLPDSLDLLTLKIQTKNQASFLKTISVDDTNLDLQFFPESGSLVHGLATKVGFKALNNQGKGTTVTGEIVNQDGELVSYFKSNSLGMGAFALVNVDKNTRYFARVTAGLHSNEDRLYALPPVEALGNILLIRQLKDQIQASVYSNYLKKDSVTIRMSCRGQQFYEIKAALKAGKLDFSVPTKTLPTGIIAFSLIDRQQRILAERLTFNENIDDQFPLQLSTDQARYEQRTKTRLRIKVPKSVKLRQGANLSVLAINKTQLGTLQNSRDHILSHFLLSSDLKGNIETPQFYFQDRPRRLRDLDALLLTQGWRKYLYQEAPKEFSFSAEKQLSVSGTVSSTLFKKKRKAIELTLMAFTEVPEIQTQITDSLGRFNFPLGNYYGKPLKILLQSKKQSGKNKTFTIDLDSKSTPDTYFKAPRTIEKVDSSVQFLIDKNAERQLIEDAFRLSTGTILLDEVVVEDLRIIPEREAVNERYGDSDVIIDGDDLRNQEQKWSYGLYSVLLYNYPEEIKIYRNRNGLYARVLNHDITLVVIDGIPVKNYDYQLIPYIPVSEVRSVEIIKSAKFFNRLYLEAVPEATPLNAPTLGDVIAIYTFAGKGLFSAQKTPGILNAVVPVFSSKRLFYAPKYDRLQAKDWEKPDYRALVHWEPNVQITAKEGAEIEFYNADNLGEMLIVVEAISDDGRIAYQELTYEVERRKNKGG